MGIITTSHSLLFIPVLTVVSTIVLSSSVFVKSRLIYPFNCSNNMQTCDSLLYHNFQGLPLEEVASFYSVNLSSIKPIMHGLKQDYLVLVPCTCKDVRGTQGYFYETFYRVQKGDTFVGVSAKIYSEQAWKIPGEEELFVYGNRVSIHLLCGCSEGNSQEIVTYTVHEEDTLAGIAELLSAQLSEIENLNSRLTQNPSFIDVGWVIFVPREKRGIQTPKKDAFLPLLVPTPSNLVLMTGAPLFTHSSKETPLENDRSHIIKCPSTKRNSLQSHLFSSTFNYFSYMQMAELSRRCLSEDPANRPEMGKIVPTLSQILISTIEWEASLAGSGEVFTGVFTGR